MPDELRTGLFLLCGLLCPPWALGIFVGFVIERRRRVYGWRGVFLPRAIRERLGGL